MENKSITINNDSALNDVLIKLCGDEGLQKEFYTEPLPMLKKMGVSTSDLLIRRYDYNNMKIDHISGTTASAFQICVSVGALIGASIGWDGKMDNTVVL